MKLFFLTILAVVAALVAITADVFAKTWGLSRRLTFFVTALLLYLLSDLAWIFFLRDVRLSVAVAWWEAIGVLPAILVGIFYFKEQLTLFEIIAILLVLSGMIMLNLGHAKG